MIDEIIKNKPNSIFDILPEELFQFDLNTDYGRSGECWEWNYAVARAIQPTSYAEIGVRFGYSLIPTLVAAPSLTYALGMDLEEYGSNNTTKDNLRKYYTGDCNVQLEHIDSQQITELPQYFTLINIDGCHTKECKMHDLRLAVGHCKYLLIDDYAYLVDVRSAIIDWLNEVSSDGWGKPSLIEWATLLPTFRGSYLVKFR
jgi:hypothetical protein